MLLITNIGVAFTLVVTIVGLVIFIRLLLLAGRMVRAVEKIAEKSK